MSRIFIYAGARSTREAIAAAISEEPELEVDHGRARAPSRVDGWRENDILVVDRDLPTEERLRILGLVWRSQHPPRTLFVQCDSDPRGAGERVMDEECRERCLSTIRSLSEGEPVTSPLRLRLRVASPRESRERHRRRALAAV